VTGVRLKMRLFVRLGFHQGWHLLCVFPFVFVSVFEVPGDTHSWQWNFYLISTLTVRKAHTLSCGINHFLWATSALARSLVRWDLVSPQHTQESGPKVRVRWMRFSEFLKSARYGVFARAESNKAHTHTRVKQRKGLPAGRPSPCSLVNCEQPEFAAGQTNRLRS
jgi:hypothetical protein